MFTHTHVLSLQHVKETTIGALILMVFLYASYIAFEPLVSRAVEDQFTVSTTVASEVSFLTAGQNVTLSPTLSGLTGGTADGSTYVKVLTNNTTGYNMTIKASSSIAMQGNTAGDNIANFATTGANMREPSYDFTSSEVQQSPGHAFGYTVQASTSADVDQSFLNDGSLCNSSGGSQTAEKCWIGASTTANTIINRTTATPNSGATTTISFRVVLRSDASDVTTEDTYTATTTLTATAN